MENESIITILMQRDGMNFQHAYLELDDMRRRVFSGEDPEEILSDYSLEPDYILEILDFYDYIA